MTRRVARLAASAALLEVLVSAPLGAEQSKTVRAAGFDVTVDAELQGFELRLDSQTLADGVDVLALRLTSANGPKPPPRLALKWSLPSPDVAGQWTTGRHMTKTLRPDWAGSRLQASMFAREAPVSCLFGSDDRNVLTFAVSDALDSVLTGSGIREEDGRVYNEVVFFSEPQPALTEYAAEVRIDRRTVPYWTALRDVGQWWAQAPGYTPAPVPESARLPMYSTWYSYHQRLDAAALLQEVAAGKTFGLESIIVDDGWQTLDSNRGYAFTGDWRPERIPDMKGFVDATHALGAKLLLWYAVPFMGKNAQAAARFKDKTLRYEERLGAYVLDPRYPEVRAYLIDTYRRAIRDWDVDGFKLDFIERFVADAQTELTAGAGRDYASVNEAADRLLTDVLAELGKVKPEVMIEFRQPYIGPLIRKYGNMLRASDCPNSYVANRVKTTDLRLLSGATAVHADMIMWHPGEPVEVAALQLLNVLFSVPQVSVRLSQIPQDHQAMLAFYTAYWRRNRELLLDGELEAPSPLGNYPELRARHGARQIVGLYADRVVRLDGPAAAAIDVVNAKHSTAVVLDVQSDLGRYRASVRDCQGQLVRSEPVWLRVGTARFAVPVSGLLSLERSSP